MQAAPAVHLTDHVCEIATIRNVGRRMISVLLLQSSVILFSMLQRSSFVVRWGLGRQQLVIAIGFLLLSVVI